MITEDNASVQPTELYFEMLHPELGADQRIEVRYKAPGDGCPMRQVFVATTREAATHAASRGGTHDVYAGVATRLGKDGTKKGVCRTSALWADLDVKEGHTRESRLRQLAGLPYHPSMLIWTGGGFHAYYLLKTPAEGPEELERAELIMQRLAEGLDGDPRRTNRMKRDYTRLHSILTSSSRTRRCTSSAGLLGPVRTVFPAL